MATLPQNQDLTAQFRNAKEPVGWPWRLLTLSFFLVLIALLSYFGLAFGYEKYLNSQIANTDAQIKQQNSKIPADKKENFIRFYSQFINLETLLKNHVFASRIFPLIERLTDTKVFYSNMDLKAPDHQLVLEGFAQSYAVLGNQLSAFEQDEMIDRYILNQSQFNEGLVRFKVTLVLSADLLKP